MSLSSSLYPPDPLRDVPEQPSQNRRDGGTCLPHQCLKKQQMQKCWGDLSPTREELRLGDRRQGSQRHDLPGSHHVTEKGQQRNSMCDSHENHVLVGKTSTSGQRQEAKLNEGGEFRERQKCWHLYRSRWISDLPLSICTSPSSGLRMRRPHPQAQAQELSKVYLTANKRNINGDEYRIGRSPDKRSWIDNAIEREEKICVGDEERASKLDESGDHPIAKIIEKETAKRRVLTKAR